MELVEIFSPLSTADVEAHLRAGLTTHRQVFMGATADGDGRIVLGRLSPRGVRLSARPRSVRNSWSPVFRGRLLSVGAGCRLVGTLGWHPFTRVFTAVWLTLAGLFLIGGAVGCTVLVVTGRLTANDLPLVVGPAVLVGFGTGLVTLAGRAGWRDAAFLRGWLAERLQG